MNSKSSTNIYHIEKDRYSCITIEIVSQDAKHEKHFAEKLKDSLIVWEATSVKAVWINIDIKYSTIIPICVKNGFEFHHAKPRHVVMTKWLSVGVPNNLPSYANQYLGCGGFVVNDQDELLVMQERNPRFLISSNQKLQETENKQNTAPLQKELPIWKLPGGQADIGEDISEAAIREVFEETGIRTTFQYIVCFRHLHKYKHGLSDFYFVCALKPLNTDIKADQMEVADAKWMKLTEFLTHPQVPPFGRYVVERYLDIRKRPNKECIQAELVQSVHSKSLCYVVNGADSANCEDDLTK